MVKPDVDLLIGIPCRDYRIHAECALSLVNTVQALEHLNVSYQVQTAAGCSLVCLARNRLAHTALAGGFSYLLMVDDDIGFTPEGVLRLLFHDVDLIGGAYQARDGGCFTAGDPRRVVGSPLLSCSWIAGGFLLVSRRCLERVAAVSPTTGIPFAPRALFATAVVDGQLEGEDMHYCRKWRALGGQVFCDPAVELTHYAGDPRHDKPYHQALLDGTADPVLPAEEAAPQRQVPA
jgi:hypothetical protein